jgi:hypothetical protein
VSASIEPAAVPTRAESRLAGVAPVLVAWLMALAILAMTIAPIAFETVRDATLFDNDDAMRLVQMHDWTAGQSWFDMTEHRVDPPTGMTSHWSRLIELPIAGSIMALSTALDRDLSERIVVAVWPCVLLAALALAMLALAARFCSPPTLLAAALILALNPLFMFQLLPGRIDHHGAQMLLSLLLAFATIRAIVDRRPLAAVAAGAVGGLSLAIGLEALPFVALAAGLFGLAFIVVGAPVRRVVAGFGMSFALSTLLLFVATVPPSRWETVAADALSPPWLWMAVAGGFALAGLALFGSESRARRAVAAIVAGGAVAGVFVAVWPHVLAGPLADTDPLVRVLWLEGVGEAKPLLSLVTGDPDSFLYFLAFPAVGWFGLAFAAVCEGRRRPDFLLLLAFATMGLLLALGQMRGASFASLFAFFGWLYPIDRAHASLGRDRNLGRVAVLGVGVIIIVAASLPFFWSAIGAAVKASPAEAAPPASCRERGYMDALAAEPRGLVLAPLRLGPRILVATDHDVIAAPYHRNNPGNRFALEALTAAPDIAHARIRERGVDYIAVCLGDIDLPRLMAYRAGSFLETLVEGPPPAWLAPLEPKGPVRAWRVID